MPDDHQVKCGVGQVVILDLEIITANLGLFFIHFLLLFLLLLFECLLTHSESFVFIKLRLGKSLVPVESLIINHRVVDDSRGSVCVVRFQIKVVVLVHHLNFRINLEQFMIEALSV